MIDENLVEVQYHDPEVNGIAYTIGELREGSQHILLLSEELVGKGIYSYTIIPRDFVRKITKLKFK